MGVRIDNTADRIGISANLPSMTAFTVAGWASHVTVGTGTERTLCYVGNDFSEFAINIRTTNNLSLRINGATSSFSANPPTDGTWYYWGMWASGTGANQLGGWWSQIDSETVTSLTRASGAVTAASFDIGKNRFSSSLFDGAFANIVVYDAALTEAEWYSGKYRYMAPARRDIVRYHWPLLDASDSRDLSGNGYSPTLTTLADWPGPAIPWMPRGFSPFVAAAGGPSSYYARGLQRIYSGINPRAVAALNGLLEH